MDKAKQMEAEGRRLIKLNIGNLAVFGFDPPEEVMRDMIYNLPNSAGYSDSKGMFAARKAVMHYTQDKQIEGVTLEDIYLGNGASDLITMATNALLDEGDELLVPTPDYPLWTAVTSLAGAKPVHYLCDEEKAGFPISTTSVPKWVRAPKASSSSTQTTPQAFSIPIPCSLTSFRLHEKTVL